MFVMYVVNEKGWYSLVLHFSKGRQLSVFQENYLKTQGMILHTPVWWWTAL